MDLMRISCTYFHDVKSGTYGDLHARSSGFRLVIQQLRPLVALALSQP